MIPNELINLIYVTLINSNKPCNYLKPRNVINGAFVLLLFFTLFYKCICPFNKVFYIGCIGMPAIMLPPRQLAIK